MYSGRSSQKGLPYCGAERPREGLLVTIEHAHSRKERTRARKAYAALEPVKKSFRGRRGKAPDDKAGWSCINEGLGMFGFDFVVLGESTVVSKPRESSLDDPALSQKAKAVPESWNNRKAGALTPKELVHPSNELTAIGCVSEDDAQPAEPSSLLDHELGPLTILNGCRVNHGHQDQAKGINKKVAFSPLHLLSSIKAAFSGLVSHFNALSVEDGRARGFFLALFLRTFSRRASLMRCQTPSFCQLAK